MHASTQPDTPTRRLPARHEDAAGPSRGSRAATGNAGTELLRGLYPGRLYDRSAAVAQLGYRWPIWIWLDGALRMEVGNVFGAHLSGFSVERCRWSGIVGVESISTPDSSFQVMFGMGSETFESGARIDSFRLLAGATSGF